MMSGGRQEDNSQGIVRMSTDAMARRMEDGATSVPTLGSEH
jgi:hypothetical protein